MFPLFTSRFFIISLFKGQQCKQVMSLASQEAAKNQHREGAAVRSPTATVFADELMGRTVGPGLMKTPIMRDEHPTRARLPVSTRVTPQVDDTAGSDPVCFQHSGLGLNGAESRGRGHQAGTHCPRVPASLSRGSGFVAAAESPLSEQTRRGRPTGAFRHMSPQSSHLRGLSERAPEVQRRR